MANGNIVDAATYYNDPDTYTGVGGGTENPWCIEDVHDFLNLSSKRSGSNWSTLGNFILVNDIDFNDHEIYKFGFTSQYNINPYAYQKGLYLDGKGHKISNIILYGPYMYLSTEKISNIEFSNLILIDADSAGGVGLNKGFTSGSVVNCKFGIFLSNSTLAYLTYSTGDFQDTTFNIYGTTSSTDNCFRMSSYSGTTYSRCLFNFNLTNTATSTTLIDVGERAISNFINCGFIGTINNYVSNSNSPLYLFNNSGFVSLTNSYFAVKTQFNNIKSDYTGYHIEPRFSCKTRCFIDSALITDRQGRVGVVVFDNLPSLCSTITTDQAHSAEYLSQIGFLTI